MNLTFQQVQEFFKSWGMFPIDEDTDDFNRDVIEQGINRACYFKMLKEAESTHGPAFGHFIARQVEATDDSFYVEASTWGELEEAWNEYHATYRGG